MYKFTEKSFHYVNFNEKNKDVSNFVTQVRNSITNLTLLEIMLNTQTQQIKQLNCTPCMGLEYMYHKTGDTLAMGCKKKSLR